MNQHDVTSTGPQGREKESAMAGENNPTAGNAGAGGSTELSDLKALVGELTTTVKTLATSQAAMVKNVDILAQSVAKTPLTDPVKVGKGEESKALTAEDIVQLMRKERETAEAASSSKAARDAYMSDKLKDLPGVYRDKLGSDPANWAAEEQSIRDGYKKDLGDRGFKTPDVGNASKDGGDTQMLGRTVIDKSKLDPVTRIGMGLKDSSPGPGPKAAN